MRGRVGTEEIDCGLSCLGSSTSQGDFEGEDVEANSRQSYLYHKLPPHLLKLSILKLDGSAFDVLIEKNATVGQLKRAIEDIFITSSEEGHSEISWSHVWGHFCLSFDGRKLLNDRTYLRDFGIMDGAQLQFVRCLSIDYSPMRRRSKSQNHIFRQPSSFTFGEIKESSSTHEGEENLLKYYDIEDHEVPLPEFRLAHFLRGCFSYPRIWSERHKGSESQGHSSRFSVQCLGCNTEGYMAMEV